MLAVREVADASRYSTHGSAVGGKRLPPEVPGTASLLHRYPLLPYGAVPDRGESRIENSAIHHRTVHNGGGWSPIPDPMLTGGVADRHVDAKHSRRNDPIPPTPDGRRSSRFERSVDSPRVFGDSKQAKTLPGW